MSIVIPPRSISFPTNYTPEKSKFERECGVQYPEEVLNLRVILLITLLVHLSVFAGIIHISADYVFPEENVITYSGNVSVFIEDDNVHISAASLVVKKISGDWKDVKAFGGIFVKTDSMESTAASLSYDLKEKSGKLFGDVTAFLVKEDATVLSKVIDFDLDGDIYSSDYRSTFLKKDTVATANTFSYESSKVHLEGDFKAINRDTKINGIESLIDLENDIMTVSSAVVLMKDATVTGDILTYDMESEGTFTGNVEAVIVRGEDIIKIVPESLFFDTNQEKYIGTGEKVQIWKGRDVYAESKEVTYEKKEGKVFLKGNVYILDKKKDVKMKAERAVLYLDEDRMEAFRAKTEIHLK
jgi:lipopolysaccharide export system protein LptA